MNKNTIFKKIYELNERMAEDALYEAVLMEVKNGDMDIVAEARAMEEGQGDKEKARSLYIKHRIRRLKDIHLAEFIEREAERATQESLEEIQRLANAKQKAAAKQKQLEHANRLFIIEKIIETRKVNAAVKKQYSNEFSLWFRGLSWNSTRTSVLTNNDLWIEFFKEYIRKHR